MEPRIGDERDESEVREGDVQRIQRLPVIEAGTIQQLWYPDLQVHHSEAYEDFYLSAVVAVAEGSSSDISLRDLALASTVDQVFRTRPQELTWLPEAEQIPDFLPAVRKKLFAEPRLVQRPAGPALLRRILKGTHTTLVDLSMFTGLEAQEVVDLLGDASKETAGERLTAVLPNMPTMTVEKLRRICQVVRYEGLYLGTTGTIELDTVLRIASDAKVKRLTCPTLFASLYEHEGRFDSAAAAQLLSSLPGP